MSDRRCDALSLAMSEQLDAALRQRGVSVYRLARTADLAENTLAYALDGRTTRTMTLQKAADALGLRWVTRLEPIPGTAQAAKSPLPDDVRFYRGQRHRSAPAGAIFDTPVRDIAVQPSQISDTPVRD